MAAAFAKHPTNMRRERHKVQKAFPEQHFSLVGAAVGKHPAGRRGQPWLLGFCLSAGADVAVPPNTQSTQRVLSENVQNGRYICNRGSRDLFACPQT